MFKKVFFQIHWFLGITAGLVLSLMGITGAITSYDQQILKWINPQSYQVQISQQPKLTPEQLYQHFQRQDPNIQINSISISHAADEASVVNIVKEGARRGKNIMLNPYTAEQLPEIKGQKFFQFILQLHRNLTVGAVGKQITGACTLMLIFFVLSGIYLRWPKKHSLKQWLFVKPKLKGRNFIWDLHAVVGTWVIVFYLIFACTGLYWSYGWWRDGMYKVLGVERPQRMGPPSAAPAGPNPAMQNRAQAERRPQGQGQGQGQPAKAARPTPAMASTGATQLMTASEQPSAAQISQALNTTWQGFKQRFGQHYSTVSFSLPKDNQANLEISFVDRSPQHERARNSASYNYHSQSFEKVSLYTDKPLNQKIMSSMLPVHRGSFMGPIYHFFAMLASLSMPLFFVTGWMLYLKRRKQKRLTQSARSAAVGLATASAQDRWTIVYASQTGMAEQAAYHTSSSLQQAGLATEVLPLKDTDIAQLQTRDKVLFVVSTYGTGEAPDLAASFVKNNLGKSADFSHMRYALLAFGSKEFSETYCLFGHQLFNWLKHNQAQALFNLVEVDNGNPNDLQRWYTALANMTHTDLHALISEKVFDDWQLTTRQLLNPNSLGAPAYELCLKPLAQQIWQAGDIAEVQTGNSLALMEQFIAQHQLNTSAELIAALRHKNLLQANAVDVGQSNWLDQLANLPSREYSIASIPEEGLLRLVVRQKQLPQGLGLGSGWLTAHSQLGENLPLRIRSNASFHLISDDRPIIFIGNGTGIAGLLSLLKQREQLQFKQNWLIFGERQREVDFFYQQQIEQWLATGHLQYADLAFSRDQAQRVYVHHKLHANQQRLREWLAKDAVLYICGSIEGMASDVERSLIEIIGEAELEALRLSERYRRDVY